MKLAVITPEKTVFDGEVAEVYLPGENGEFGILPGHAEMIAGLRIGICRFIQEEKSGTTKILLSGGVCHILNDEIKVLAKTVEYKENINSEQSRHNLKEVEMKLLESGLTGEERKNLEEEKDKELVRLELTSV